MQHLRAQAKARAVHLLAGERLDGRSGAGIAWLAILIVGQPVVRFFELRRDVREQLFYSANLPPPKEGEIDARFVEAHDALRRLGAKMSTFSETTVAARIVHRFGYNSSAAGSGLIGLSNTLHTYGGRTPTVAHASRGRSKVSGLKTVGGDPKAAPLTPCVILACKSASRPPPGSRGTCDNFSLKGIAVKIVSGPKPRLS